MREELRAYMERMGLNQTQVARELGKSTAVINQYLKGTYAGRTEEVDEAVRRLLQRQKDKVVERRFKADFVPTLAAKKCLDVIRFAHVESDINVIIGAAGLGKTVALKEYVKQNPDVVLVEVEPSCSPKVLLKTLCQKLGVADTGANHELFVRITQKLCEGRLIIVDEAELLSVKSLECIRRIHDITKCGVVLAGMPRLLINLKGKYGELAQLYSRVGLLCDLGNALPKDDIEMLAESGLGTSEFNEKLFQVSKGNARRLTKLMRGVIRTAEMNSRPINNAIINQYAEMLIN
ncbi:AAA family ATPase [Pasteurellaceae bacterium HPA106]|uniref:AAA family ATPase n=1 Tax=Spirabiliibacterium pneumoniae TaxID=221400 RepID=UPI001AAD6C74|nr:AAA family ATPase [Spirabiliibacterium pneumoniae]MBE2895486.1 AAA family ATPase [Spirabiliibacterium pneumoniae]